MESREAAALVAVIAAAYPTWPASRETVAIYVDALADLDARDVSDAIAEIIRTEERWPAVATIRRRVAARAGALAPSPAQAWEEIRSISSAGGSPGDVSHPAISEAVRTIGWWDLCRSTSPETIRAQFLRIYEDCQRRHDSAILSSQSAGTALEHGSRDRLSPRGSLRASQRETA